ncbi:MAG TPA: MFS transporter [Steroidobacteraceae bacterium]|jgi:AAA family ATP:ADP antiporter|nr:MFS transporter [Steroidobacteraceae bacterium]
MNPPEGAAAPANNPGTASPPDRKAPWFPADGAEARIVISGFFLLFCVLGGYFAVRPVRETIGTVLGRAATQDLWFFTALFAILIVPFYGWLVARVRRAVLLPSIYGFMAVAFAATAQIFGDGTMDPMVARVFYVAISVMNLLLVSAFWSFMLEILSSDQTKRLFGFIAAGGTLGALLGPGATALLVKSIGNAGVLYLGAGMYLMAIVLSRVLLAQWRHISPEAGSGPGHLSEREKALGGNPFAGFMLVMRNPYLRAIALFIAGISAINTFLYFEQLDQVEKQFEELAARTQVFASLDVTVQGLVILTQLSLTGFIATRIGVIALLATVPFIMVFGLTVYAVFGTFSVMAAAMVIRRWGEYALIRPGREMLFSKVDKESKYKAKNVCDVAVYRIADAGFAQVKKVLDTVGMGGTAQALIAASVAALWAINGWWLGRRFEKEKEKTGSAA